MAVDSEKRKQTTLVALQGAGSGFSVRRRTPPAFRTRPGDACAWVRLDLSPEQAWALRDAAEFACVSVDAWLAIMVEFHFVLDALDQILGPNQNVRLVMLETVQTMPVAVAPTQELRAWQASLSRAVVSRIDELPEVVLPERLLARTRDDIDVTDVLAIAFDWPLALACELAASGRGQVLEAFILQAQLARSLAAQG